MARGVKRGDIWMYAFAKPDKKRPVLVISRQSVIPLLRTVMVAPLTSAIHGVPGSRGGHRLSKIDLKYCVVEEWRGLHDAHVAPIVTRML